VRCGIAVLDIGKTNKKFVLFNEDLEPVEIRKTNIETYRSPDGFDLEDVEAIEQWMLEELKRAAQQYPVRMISISTHGASVVCVGKDGKLVVPPLAYTNEVPESVHQEFFRLFGPREQLQKETATAEVRPLINVGKLLFFVSQKYPEEFSRIHHILLYPQYFAFRLTGIPAAEHTYVGCHTYLWNPHRQDWSSVAYGLKIRSLLPERVRTPSEVLGRITPSVSRVTGLDPDTRVTLGIHDSNSSMVPYLISQEEDFILNSTGSWCVAMHPMDQIKFREEELGKMVFYNLSYCGRPIKTSILPGGLELDTYWAILQKLHHRTDDPGWDPEVYDGLIREKEVFVLPSALRGAGQFPESHPRVREGNNTYLLEEMEGGRVVPQVFRDYQRGFAATILSIAVQTKVALERVGLVPGIRVFIEGGFRRNEAYLKLLASLLPDNPLYVTDFEEATSVGAALCAKAAYEDLPVETFRNHIRITTHRVEREEIPALDRYAVAFLEKVQHTKARL